MDGAKLLYSLASTDGKLSPIEGDLLPVLIEYRTIVSALQYLTIARQDIAFSINQVCQFLHAPTTTQLAAIKHILHNLKGIITQGLCYTSSALTTEEHFHADYADDLEKQRFTNGYCVYLEEIQFHRVPRSRTQFLDLEPNLNISH